MNSVRVPYCLDRPRAAGDLRSGSHPVVSLGSVSMSPSNSQGRVHFTRACERNLRHATTHENNVHENTFGITGRARGARRVE